MIQYELRDVAKEFPQGPATIYAVRGLDLAIDRGEFVVVEGPSGSGKSTLLQILGALDRPTRGQVLFEGRDLSQLPDRDLTELRLRSFGFIFQQFNLIPTLTAHENVESALAPTGMKSPERRARAEALLDEVGLADRAGHLPSQLSGGQQQRVAIARALANEPHVILADEPTGNLDTRTGEEILGLLERLSREHGQTVVLVTHDRRIAEAAARVLHMHDGQIEEHEPSLLEPEPVQAPAKRRPRRRARADG